MNLLVIENSKRPIYLKNMMINQLILKCATLSYLKNVKDSNAKFETFRDHRQKK
jgi:hypothetical protein